MTNLETRKAQLREYIEEKLPRYGHVNGDHLWYGHSHGKNAALDDHKESTKEESNAIPVVKLETYQKLSNESALIAEQLLECIEALEKIADYSTCEELHPGCKKYKSYEDGWHGVAEYAKQTLNKISGEK